MWPCWRSAADRAEAVSCRLIWRSQPISQPIPVSMVEQCVDAHLYRCSNYASICPLWTNSWPSDRGLLGVGPIDLVLSAYLLVCIGVQAVRSGVRFGRVLD